MRILFIIFGLVISINNYSQKNESLALTPPMAWNTFNTFAGNFNEKLIREMADIIVSSGMKDAGYTYIIIDDNWTGNRDSLGFLTVDKSRFPSGMEAMSEYIHSKGLKLGLYSDAGYKTCSGFTSSRGHEFQDAIMFARWGADYLKYDWCNADDINAKGAYTTMRDAIYASKRPMIFSLCEWGNNKPWEWASTIGHLWRTTGDICNCWSCTEDYGTYKKYGVMTIFDMQDGLRQYAGPGHWNDPDMLEVGNGKLTAGENRAHFSMWCMIAAPLIAGNDLRKMTKETLEILTNHEVIGIDQDSLGIQGFKQEKIDSLEIWYKPLKGGDWALCFLNRGFKAATIEYDWKKQVVVDKVFKLEPRFDQIRYVIRDLWLKKNIGLTDKTLKTIIPSHDVLMLRLIK
jgi:alpha-galactosidase